MNLKNYTSSVPADTTIARIERLLVDGGATGIAKEYEAGRVKASGGRLLLGAGKYE